jgi:hypothetical protein
MKNLVVMTAFRGSEPYEPYVAKCAHSWNLWCKKHGHEFIFWDELPDGNSDVPATFQRMRVLDVIEKSESKDCEQISLVDYDTFIFPWADNYFDKTNKEFAAVNDWGYSSHLNRSIQMVKNTWFPKSTVNWGNYFNAGFFTFGWKHRPVLDAVYNFYKTQYDLWLKTNMSRRQAALRPAA